MREQVEQRKRRRNGGEIHIQVMEGNIQREGDKGGKATDWKERRGKRRSRGVAGRS